MSEQVTLQKIIEDVLEEKGVNSKRDIRKVNDVNSLSRSLRRSFNSLVEKLGGDINTLKDGNFIIFSEYEIPFIKIIIRQIYERSGAIEKIIKNNCAITSADLHDFIQSIVDEAAKSDCSDEDLLQFATYLSNKFKYAYLYSLERCHMYVNTLAMNLHDMTYSDQVGYMNKLEHILKKEFALRVAEMAYGILDVSELTEKSKHIYKYDFGNRRYSEYDPDIRNEYIERDKNILLKIKQDDDLRAYIEKKFGKKAEEIFNYANLTLSLEEAEP